MPMNGNQNSNSESGDILDQIVEDKKKRLVQHKALINEETMKEMALALLSGIPGQQEEKERSFYQALKQNGLSIIGEFKKSSPSMGVIQSKINLTDRVSQYNASVDAISCLTEEDHFHGNTEYLKEIRKISPLPIIRKDFIIDDYQVYEAKVIGADAILLIAAILDDAQMKHLYDLAYSLELDVLLEVHNEEEMLRALDLGAKIIGVNNRNLKDFSISLDTTKRLSLFLDEHSKGERPVFVSESGVTETPHIEFLKKCNVDALLIGRAFMESENPLEVAKEWKAVYNRI